MLLVVIVAPFVLTYVAAASEGVHFFAGPFSRSRALLSRWRGGCAWQFLCKRPSTAMQADWDIEERPPGLQFERFAVHKAALSGILGSCVYSAWRFKNKRSGAGIPLRALFVGVACSSMSGGLAWWRAAQLKRHQDGLERMQRSGEALRLLGTGYTAPIPEKELDEATGQRAVEANEELLKQMRKAERKVS
eukprot:TRINITY_DN76030_c0_g1_i1.p1 TRINITY_DN76030_c0_g1~~TRINITY_DN76030_c0_g1_i1.p1  ORF type:complete len:191 (+),score=31.16 TRINITY_DN76030_c0_g1_i1:3-575(+)